MDIVPGLTEYRAGTRDVLITPINKIYAIDCDTNKKRILIATQNISYANLYNNGLLQNIIILYRLFEAMGFEPFFLLHSVAKQQDSDILLDSKYRCMVPEDILTTPQPIHLYIEVGMSIEHTFINCLHSMGAKAVKLYYGNTLNIDIENSTVARYVKFPHHTYSELDEIWTSPHYTQNIEYLCSLYRIPLAKGKIAPYLWDPMFIQNNTTYSPCEKWQETDIVIVEPNISFQKCSLLPLLLADAFARACPEWKGHVKCYNSQRLSLNTHSHTVVIPGLFLCKERRLDLCDRATIRELMQRHAHGVFIGHQVNNEYNYMTLELMTQGFPVLHTASAWKEFGYFWSELSWPEALNLLERVMKTHTNNAAIYDSHAKQLSWAHSIHNPHNQKAYLDLIL